MVEPSTAYDAKGLLKAAIRDDDPVLYFEHKYLYRRIKDEVPDDDYVVPLGKARVRREGRTCRSSPSARWSTWRWRRRRLEADGVQAEVLDLRTLAPLDREAILTSVAKTSRVLLLYEARPPGGSAASWRRSSPKKRSSSWTRPVVRHRVADTPVPTPAARSGVPAERARRSSPAAKSLATVLTIVRDGTSLWLPTS